MCRICFWFFYKLELKLKKKWGLEGEGKVSGVDWRLGGKKMDDDDDGELIAERGKTKGELTQRGEELNERLAE